MCAIRHDLYTRMHMLSLVHARAHQVGGMSCSGCTSNVEACLKQLPGVTRAGVSLVTGMAEVGFDGNVTGVGMGRSCGRGSCVSGFAVGRMVGKPISARARMGGIG